MGNLLKNWKTTLAGLGAIATGVASFANGDSAAGLTAILTGLGLIFARDANKP